MSDEPVVVLGDVMSDVAARLAAPPVPGSDTPAVVEMRPGGGGANVAAWLAWLGAPVVRSGAWATTRPAAAPPAPWPRRE